jgi:hypothetical protein
MTQILSTLQTELEAIERSESHEPILPPPEPSTTLYELVPLLPREWGPNCEGIQHDN